MRVSPFTILVDTVAIKSTILSLLISTYNLSKIDKE